MSNLLRKSAAATAGAAILSFSLAGLAAPSGAQEAAPPKSQAPRARTIKKAAPGKGTARAADEDAEESKSRSSRTAPPVATHRVPRYFGGLNLTEEQKEEIYAVEARYLPQIQDLEKKADALRDRQMADCEAVLTAPQKKALAEARKSAAERRKAAADGRKAEDEEEEKAEPETKKGARKPATID